MKISSLCVAGCAALLFAITLFAASAESASINLTWTGGGGDFNWTNPANWNGVNYPVDNNYSAIFNTGTGNITITNVQQNINQITTGGDKITLSPASGSITVRSSAVGGPTTNGTLNIGSGGMQINGSVRFENGTSFLNAAGDFKATGLSWGNSGTITQTGGSFDVGSFAPPLTGGNIPSWSFAGTSANTITGGFVTTGYTFTGSPTTVGTTRLNYSIDSGNPTTGAKWDLNGKSIVANQINIQGSSGNPVNGRHAYLSDLVGGVVDANNLIVGTGNYAAAYLDLHGTSVTLRGAGTIYENRSINNTGDPFTLGADNVTPAKKFDITDNTTFKFDPAAGAANVDTGSTDSGLTGFANNFAFNNVTIATGDAITLTGNQNVGGSANNALYVNGTLRGETNSTLNLNAHNAYVNGTLELGNSAGKFTVSNGNISLTSSATAHFEINGTTAGTGYDQLVLTGTSTISLNNATLDLDINALAPGIYVLIDNQTSNLINGTFLGLADGASISTGNPKYQAHLTYLGNAALGQMFGGNDLMLQITFVPEPSTALLLGLGLVGISQLRRKRRAVA